MLLLINLAYQEKDHAFFYFYQKGKSVSRYNTPFLSETILQRNLVEEWVKPLLGRGNGGEIEIRSRQDYITMTVAWGGEG